MEGRVAVSLADRPELREALDRLHAAAWPAFTSRSPVVREYWERLFAGWSETQFVLLDPDGNPVAAGNASD